MSSHVGIPQQRSSAAYPDASPDRNPLDGFRVTITHELSRITGVDGNLAFNSLDRPTALRKGDFILAVPRLRMKNSSPSELARKVVAEVCVSPRPAYLFRLGAIIGQYVLDLLISLTQAKVALTPRLPMASTSPSLSNRASSRPR